MKFVSFVRVLLCLLCLPLLASSASPSIPPPNIGINKPQRWEIHNLRSEVNSFTIDASFQANIPLGGTYYVSVFLQDQPITDPSTGLPVPQFLRPWHEVTQYTTPVFDRVNKTVTFHVPGQPATGCLMVMVRGRFGDPSHGGREHASVAVLMDEYPTHLDDGHLPGTTVPITYRPLQYVSLTPPTLISADGHFETDWTGYSLGDATYFVKPACYGTTYANAYDPAANSSTSSLWATLNPRPTDDFDSSDTTYIHYHTDSFPNQSLMGIFLDGEYHFDIAGQAKIHKEVSGLLRCYPEAAIGPTSSHELSLDTHTAAFYQSFDIALRSLPRRNLSIIAVCINRDFGVPEQRFQDLHSMLGDKYDVISFNQPKELLDKLKALRSMPLDHIDRLDIIGHGYNDYCGTIQVCELASMRDSLSELLDLDSTVYLTGCLTGTCSDPVSIGQAFADLGICRVFGTVGFVPDDCSLEEMALHDFAFPFGCFFYATPYVSSQDLTMYRLCTNLGLGHGAYKELLASGGHHYVCPPRIVVDREVMAEVLKDHSDAWTLLQEITKATLKYSKPTPFFPHIAIGPSYIFLGPDGEQYEILNDARVLRRRSKDDSIQGTAWQMPANPDQRAILRTLWSPVVADRSAEDQKMGS